jgi:alpha-L-rhamnosidase
MTAAVADMQAEQMRCEYRTDPVGLDAVAPRLSWVLASARRAVSPSAYRILVAGSAERLAADGGDLWDSGKVASDQPLHVEYAGKALASRPQCWRSPV